LRDRGRVGRAAARRSRNCRTFANTSMITPSIKNPPGGRIMITQGSKRSPNSDTPNRVPVPSTSRAAPRQNSANANPIAMPTASITA
jgi:hypothetical protein